MMQAEQYRRPGEEGSRGSDPPHDLSRRQTRTAKPPEAAGLAFALAGRPHGTEQLLRAACRLEAMKAWDVHDLKFPVALFEDLDLVSPHWRPHLLAAGVYSFQGSARPDNPVMQQVREALRKL